MRREQIINLWQNVFGDSDDFIKLYFDHVYKEEYAVTIEEDGRVLSALQVLPYQMTYYGNEISVGYISGASTLPSEQGKGLMKKLLQKAYQEMINRNITITALIPADKWLFNYYESQGYANTFDYSIEKYTADKNVSVSNKYAIADAHLFSERELFTYFDHKLRERSICVLHTFEDFRVILTDHTLSGGRLFTVIDSDQKPIGMGFASPKKQDGERVCVYVKEIFYDNEEIKDFLLQSIAGYYNTEDISIKTPYNINTESIHLGMVKILNPELLIQLWMKAHPHSNISIDDMKNMTDQQLVHHLFDYSNKTAYMSLMLD